jgi:hypothetical protein
MLSHHPEPWPVLHLFPGGRGEGRHTSGPFDDEVRDTFASEASPARPPFTLTATLFGALRASLFGARTLPADFCNETRRTDTNRSSRFLARTEAMTSFPCLTRHARPSTREAVTRGEPRMRPFVPTPVPVPPACAGLPDRDTEPTAPPPDLRLASMVMELSGD